jgi:hypothetical protein
MTPCLGTRTLRRLTQPIPRRRHPRFKRLLPRALALLAMLLLPALAHATPARAAGVSQGVDAVACVDTTTCYAVGGKGGAAHHSR